MRRHKAKEYSEELGFWNPDNLGPHVLAPWLRLDEDGQVPLPPRVSGLIGGLGEKEHLHSRVVVKGVG